MFRYQDFSKLPESQNLPPIQTVPTSLGENHILRELENGASEIVIFALPYDYTTWDHLWAQKFYNTTDREVTFDSTDFVKWMSDVYR